MHFVVFLNIFIHPERLSPVCPWVRAGQIVWLLSSLIWCVIVSNDICQGLEMTLQQSVCRSLQRKKVILEGRDIVQLRHLVQEKQVVELWVSKVQAHWSHNVLSFWAASLKYLKTKTAGGLMKSLWRYELDSLTTKRVCVHFYWGGGLL